jgi:hypothetical protein
MCFVSEDKAYGSFGTRGRDDIVSNVSVLGGVSLPPYHSQIMKQRPLESEICIRHQANQIFHWVFAMVQVITVLSCFSTIGHVDLPGYMAVRRPGIAVISALIGMSERTAKAHSRQTLDADYYVFTNNPNLRNMGRWVFDYNAYHISIWSPIDNLTFVNSLSRNHHPYMIYKYYKMQFHRIPRLRRYEMILWIDLDKTFHDPDCLERLMEIFRLYPDKNLVARSHPAGRHCRVAEEVTAALRDERWTLTLLRGERQPFQDVRRQYNHYLSRGFREEYWTNEDLRYRNNRCIGLWQTDFIAYRMSSANVYQFLDAWYLETLRWTTQCQVSAPYVFQKLHEVPYTLPDAARPHFPRIIRHRHGQ